MPRKTKAERTAYMQNYRAKHPKISTYIRQQLALGKTEFDIGIGKNQTVNDTSPTRVKFKVEKKVAIM